MRAYQNNNVIPNNNPNSNNAANSQKLYKLLATNAPATGLGITLKVMSGDKIDIYRKSYYFQNNATNVNYDIPGMDILTGLFGSPGSIAGAHGATAELLNNNPSITSSIFNFLNDPARENGMTPKAALNYILLDENFNVVGGDFSPVGVANSTKDYSNESKFHSINVAKSGYIYVYASNESPVKVFFDNIQLVHTRGPLVEETHYYPFG